LRSCAFITMQNQIRPISYNKLPHSRRAVASDYGAAVFIPKVNQPGTNKNKGLVYKMNEQRFEKQSFDEGRSFEEIRYMYHINDNYFVYASVFKDKTVYGVWNDIKQENSGIRYEEFDPVDEPEITGTSH
jgi:hypothetical protein